SRDHYIKFEGGKASQVTSRRDESPLDVRPEPARPAVGQSIQGGSDLWPTELKSVPSGSRRRTKRSLTSGGASPRHAGPRGNLSPIGRRACSWRRSRSSPATGRPSTTGAHARRD